ncbi:MAG TPA: glycoside hydrolase family 3 N-terminal domain-containing protein [Candidatus Saccharimonadales bacterium]|nr:glycoside hydrolase family 3 N-terminal domain-containing protein [Candidatus Saccharimonadales bacterium]
MRSITHSAFGAVAIIAVLAACGAPSITPKVSPATPTASDSPRPTATPNTCSNASVLASWTLNQLAEQTLVIPVSETDVTSITAEIEAGAGGIILFGSTAPTNLSEVLKTLTATAPGGIAPFVMTDEEGGAVQRMANLVGSIPSARSMGATMKPGQIQQLITTSAKKMRAAGITMDLAPVLDLDNGDGPNNEDPDGTRSFSLNASTTTVDAAAFAAGLTAGGVTPVMKHFPGLGQATANTDVNPATTLPWTTLERAGLLPFESAIAAGTPAVMIADAVVPGLSTLPASISPNVITGELRHQLGFQGLVMTDSLSAGALVDIGYNVPKAVVAAITAGADMVLYTAAAASVASLTNSTVAAVVAAVGGGTLDRSRLENAVGHILSVKHVDLCAA